MNVSEAIEKRRAIRKYTGEKVERETLVELVRLASLAAYGQNLQPLKFKIIDGEMARQVFPHTKWSGYVPEAAPAENEQPPAYIAAIGDKTLKNQFLCDVGAAMTTMALAAVEKGLATCWLGAIDRVKISEIISLPDEMELVHLLAVGYPAQKSRTAEMQGGDVKYWYDNDGTINVPKRPLDEILL